MAEASQSLKSFLTFSILSALYILSMFYRVSNAIIAPNLIQDLGLDAETLGILGGSFFYSFALLQIPMGPMLDRIGPRIIITAFTLVGIIGAFLFACGQSFTVAFLGRIFIGIGMASIFMGSLKVFTLQFPIKNFSILMGTIASVGALGSILAASPLAYITSMIGWRTTFFITSAISAILALLAFWALRGEKQKGKGNISHQTFGPEIGILQSIRLILGSLAFWQIGAVAFFRYGTFVGLQGLWLGPYLIDIKGYSPVQAGNLLILLAIGGIVGGPIAGGLSDKTLNSRKGFGLCGLSLYALSLFILTGFVKIQSPFWYGLIFFLVGIFHSSGMLIYSHAKDLYPITISGTVMTFVNFFTMAGAAVFMPAMGKIIELFPRVNHTYPAKAYHLSFLICFLGMAVSIIFYAFSKRERKGDVTPRRGDIESNTK